MILQEYRVEWLDSLLPLALVPEGVPRMDQAQALRRRDQTLYE